MIEVDRHHRCATTLQGSGARSGIVGDRLLCRRQGGQLGLVDAIGQLQTERISHGIPRLSDQSRKIHRPLFMLEEQVVGEEWRVVEVCRGKCTGQNQVSARLEVLDQKCLPGSSQLIGEVGAEVTDGPHHHSFRKEGE